MTSPVVLLTTPRLTLRRFTPDDVELLFELDADPEVRRYVHAGPPDRERIRRETMPRLLAWYEGPWGYWAAEEGPERAFVGWFHLRPWMSRPGGVPELGYRLRRPAWGRGLASEGARALVAHGRDVLGLRRIEALTLIGNLASQRVLEKAGFVRAEEFVYDPPAYADLPTTPEQRRSYRFVWTAPG